MPLYLDRHEPSPDFTPEALAEAHRRDLEVQSKYGVSFLTYWHDPSGVFCLAEAPRADVVAAVHSEAHGAMPSRVVEVDPALVSKFFGALSMPGLDPEPESPFRTIMFTDLEGSTAIIQRLGDDAAIELLRRHDAIVREALQTYGGREVKHTGDGIMACFTSATRAVTATIEMQRRFADHNGSSGDMPLRVRVGMSAGEPVTDRGDLFGATVNLAARVCAASEPGCILASSAVRDLSMGKGFRWDDRGTHQLKGFDEPIRLYEAHWRA